MDRRKECKMRFVRVITLMSTEDWRQTQWKYKLRRTSVNRVISVFDYLNRNTSLINFCYHLIHRQYIAYLEVITWWSRPQANTSMWQSNLLCKFTGTSTNISAILTRQLAQFSLVDIRYVLRSQRARCKIPFQTNWSRTLPIDAQLRTVVATSFIRSCIWRWTLWGAAVAHWRHRTIWFWLTHFLLIWRNKSAVFATATRSLTGAAKV